jgi:hypothetical protein
MGEIQHARPSVDKYESLGHKCQQAAGAQTYECQLQCSHARSTPPLKVCGFCERKHAIPGLMLAVDCKEPAK